MTDTMIADMLAIKSVIAVLVADLDDESIRSLCASAADVIQNYSLHSDETKHEATKKITNLLDLDD